MKSRAIAARRVARDGKEVSEPLAVARSTPNGEVTLVEARLKQFEDALGFSSAQMIERVSRGELEETSEIGAWLMSVQLRNHLAAVKTRAR